ncbi:MAG: hypothetical protein PHX08_01870 [Lachnospiraceae bacterium]|nr:hypothetical protein [Lachnospiraceae bacterium]
MSNLTDLAEKEIIRREILTLCNTAVPVGCSAQVLKNSLNKMGHDVTEQDVIRQVTYLKEKELIKTDEVKNTVLGIYRVVAHITAAGIDYLEGNAERVTGISE